MIIISNKPGQLGNLLFIYSGFLAYGLENDIKIINPAFYNYRFYFKGTTGAWYMNKLVYNICFIKARLLQKLRVHTRLINVIALDNGEHVELEKESGLRSSWCFVQGWLFRADRLLVKHKHKVFDFFSPVEPFKKKIDLFFEENFPDKNRPIIAIHVRRGDYKTFENGRYYYSNEQYTGIIDQLSQLFKDLPPYFLVCSNEKIIFNKQPHETATIKNAPGHELLDMYCMSKCTYIAGPPSTYTMWASLYGHTPLYMIHDPAKEIFRTDFKVYTPDTTD